MNSISERLYEDSREQILIAIRTSVNAAEIDKYIDALNKLEEAYAKTQSYGFDENRVLSVVGYIASIVVIVILDRHIPLPHALSFLAKPKIF